MILESFVSLEWAHFVPFMSEHTNIYLEHCAGNGAGTQVKASDLFGLHRDFF